MLRKSPNPHETILRHLNALSRTELEELQRVIRDKLADMLNKDQPEPEPKANEGWIETKYIPDSHGKQHGPYYYQRWRDESGKMRSKYLKGYGRKLKSTPTPEPTEQE